MDQILTEKINQLLRQVSLIEILRDSQKVVHRGGNQYLVQCPFHGGGGEKNPSMSVDDDKGLYKCFTCNEDGNIIKYLRVAKKLSFKDSISYLGKRFSIDVSDFFSSKGSKKAYIDKESKRINKIAANFYGKNLLSKNDEAYKYGNAIDYLKKRRIPFEIIKRFKIGYAPAYWDLLTKSLQKKNIKNSSLLALGLSKTKNNNRLYDAFINRIIFPIINENDEVIGFGGRSIDNTDPKYLNSKESFIFKKKFTLYGINIAKNAIMQRDNVMLVEGYMDVIALHKMGISNAVGTLGTACTEYHIKMLTKYTKNIVFAFDNDDAGIRATESAIRIALKENVNPAVSMPNEVKDFDEYFVNHTVEDFNILYELRISWYDFLINNMLKLKDDSLEFKVTFLQKMFTYLVLINHNVIIDEIINHIGARLSIDKNSLSSDFERYKKGFSIDISHKKTSYTDTKSKEENTSEYSEEKELIYLLIVNPNLITKCEEHLTLEDFNGKIAEELYIKILIANKAKITTDDLCLALDNKHIKEKVNSIRNNPMYTENVEDKIELAITKMRQRSIKRKKQKIIMDSQIHNILQGDKDIDKLCISINEIQNINKNTN